MRMGRPRLPKEERSSAVLAIRFLKDELETIRGAAKDDGQTTTAWAREVLVAFALGDEPNMKLCRGNKKYKRKKKKDDKAKTIGG